MISTVNSHRLSILAAAFLLLWAFGCSSDNSTDSTPDSETAQEIADQASASLADLMMSVIDTTLENVDSTFRPRDIDFTGVNTSYRQALNKDPNCRDAQFGVAFTGLLLIMADDGFNNLVDDFKNLYDTVDVTRAQLPGIAPRIDVGGKMFVEGVPLKPRGLEDVMPSPFELDRMATSLALVEPSISHLQEILETTLLPRVQEARQLLAEIVRDSGYTFVITAEMQGNPGASRIVVDRSDFQLFLTISEAIEAGLHVICARNLDLIAYSYAGVEEALSQSSSFLNLRDDGVGAGHMAAAKARVLGCLNGINQTVAFLEAEIGTSQTDDLIKVYSGDLSDLHAIRDTVTSILEYFDGPRQLDVIWGTGGYWDFDGQNWVYHSMKDTVSLTVDISRFFDNPISNYKDFLPGYEVTIESVDNLYQVYAADHFSRDRYWAAMGSIYGLTRPNDTPYFAYHLPDANTQEFYQLLATYPASEQMVFGWEDVYNYCGPGATDLWCYWSNCAYTYRDYWRNPDQFVACYEWNAVSFAEWEFPNPTMNGLLPGMTSAQLKNIWSEDLNATWHAMECDTVQVGF